MKNEVKKILKELNFNKQVKNISFEENNFMFFQKIIILKLFSGDSLKIILNAYNKKEFLKNTYTNEIKKQILEQKYLFEEV